MITCINCQARQLDGTIFCAECGASLVPTRRHETTASLGQRGDVWTPAPVITPVPEPPATDAPALTLVVINSGRRIPLDVSDDLLIGRRDEQRGIYPDIDLGLDGGYDAGVSRRHAILSHKEGTYRVEDLGSANGTFVNGKRLSPQTLATIAHGDELRCATLVLRVEMRR
jgi:hypothetical protein